MSVTDEQISRVEKKRALIREEMDRIVALVKQDHLDDRTIEHVESHLDAINAKLIVLHTKCYRNANNNMLKNWDLDA